MTAIMLNELESAIVEWVSKNNKQYKSNVIEVFDKSGYNYAAVKEALDKMITLGPLYLTEEHHVAFKFPEEDSSMNNGGFDKQQVLDHVSDENKKLRDLIIPKYIQESLSQNLKAAPEPEPARDDAVHSPSHYTRGGIEVIDFIEAKGLNFHLGNVVKYVSRAGFKQDAKLQDLEKALWYLTREIKRIKTQES